MDCCSPYPEFANRHSSGVLNGSSQEGVSPYYNYSSSTNGGMRYPLQGSVPQIFRGGAAIPPLPSPALPQAPSNGIDSPVYNEYPNNDRYNNNYPNHAPYTFGGNLTNGGYFNGYNREHNSNYNYYHPYDGYNRYSYHHKDTYSSNYNTYSSPYYQRDHNHHHQPPPPSPSPHHHYHNPYMYNPHIHHGPQTPTYLTDTDGNQTSSSSNSNTPGSLYSEYPQSPVTPYPPSVPSSTSSNSGGTSNATGFPYTNKDGKIRKSTGRDKEKSKVGGGRKTSNNSNSSSSSSFDSSRIVDPIDRCGTPFHGPSHPPTYSNDPYTNFPFGMINRMNQPHQHSYMATQPLPSNFLGNQVPWGTSGSGLNRNRKGTISNGSAADEQMPPPPPSGSAPRTTTPSAGFKNESKNLVETSSETSENPKTQPSSAAPKASRPVKRTRKKAKPNSNTSNTNNNVKPSTTSSNNNKIEQIQKEQKLSEINKNITPLPGFQQAFGSTEIGRFSEVFFNLSESPIIDQLFVESEADTLSPQPWETGDSLEGPHFNLQIGAYYAGNYYNNNNNNTNSGSSNNTNLSDLYSNTSSCINIHNNNYNYYQYDSGGSSCSNNSNNYSIYNSNNSNNNFIGNNSNINNCYFREITCSDY